jgi:hypothetical protein
MSGRWQSFGELATKSLQVSNDLVFGGLRILNSLFLLQDRSSHRGLVYRSHNSLLSIAHEL